MDNVLTNLFESIDPEKTILSEEKREELNKLFESKLEEIKQKAFEDAIEKVDEDHGKKMEELLEQMDEDHGNKMQEILEKLDEDHGSKLEEILESVDEDYGSKLEEILEKIDEDNGAKAEEIIDYIQEDHGQKLQNVLDKIDTDHTEKLQTVLESFKDQDTENVVDELDKYLDTYLEEIKPEETVINETRLSALEKMYNQMREILVINDEKVEKEFAEGIIDAKQQLDEKDEKIDSLMLEKAELNRRIKSIESKHLLEDKIKNVSPKMKAYLETHFKDADQDEIEEKFDEAVEAFEESEREEHQRLVLEKEKDNEKQVPTKVIEEQAQDKTTDSQQMNTYINMINKVK